MRSAWRSSGRHELSADIVDQGIVLTGAGRCCAISTSGCAKDGLPLAMAEDPLSWSCWARADAVGLQLVRKISID